MRAGRFSRPCRSVSQIGTEATIRAARPEGTRFSAQLTRPLPPSSISAPIAAAGSHCLGAGFGVPESRTHA